MISIIATNVKNHHAETVSSNEYSGVVNYITQDAQDIMQFNSRQKQLLNNIVKKISIVYEKLQEDSSHISSKNTDSTLSSLFREYNELIITFDQQQKKKLRDLLNTFAPYLDDMKEVVKIQFYPTLSLDNKLKRSSIIFDLICLMNLLTGTNVYDGPDILFAVNIPTQQKAMVKEADELIIKIHSILKDIRFSDIEATHHDTKLLPRFTNRLENIRTQFLNLLENDTIIDTLEFLLNNSKFGIALRHFNNQGIVYQTLSREISFSIDSIREIVSPQLVYNGDVYRIYGFMINILVLFASGKVMKGNFQQKKPFDCLENEYGSLAANMAEADRPEHPRVAQQIGVVPFFVLLK